MHNYKSLMLQELKEIYESERWLDHDNPTRKRIPELWERIDDPGKYRELRNNNDLKLLRETIEVLEESFNEDWLPYEFFGMKFNDVKLFIHEVLSKLPNSDDSETTQILKRCHKEIMESTGAE